MQDGIIVKLLNLSYQGSIVIGIILIVRYLMGLIKVPKKFAYVLWSVAFIRLVCPIAFESALSIMPDNVAPVSTIVQSTNKEQSDHTLMEEASVNVAIGNSIPKDNVENSVDPIQVILFSIQVVWLIGVIALSLYSLVTYIILRRKLTESVRGVGNIYWSDHIQTPFVLGILKPRIYMPAYMKKSENSFIIRHEEVHIKRKDHIIKIIAYVITVFHWFNPLVWIAYRCMNRDMEMSCDESVMKSYSREEYKGNIRKEYATLLLNLSVGKNHFLGAPLAFKEGDVKSRVKNITRYKKPLVIVVSAIVIGCAVLAVSLLSNPVSTSTLEEVIPSINKVDENAISSIGITMTGKEDYIPAAYANQIIDRLKKIEVSKKSEKISLTETTSDAILFQLYTTDTSKAEYTVVIQGEKIGCINKGEESMVYSLIKPNVIEDFIKQIYGSMIEANPDTNESDLMREEDELNNEIPVQAPTIDLKADIGADGVTLDYADNDIVIFHGYFGLFVYQLSDQKIIGAVDLEPIGCNYTQGDSYCEVFVSMDGKFVYLHPMNQTVQYTYEVDTKKLTQSEYNLDGIAMFDGLEDNFEQAVKSDAIYSYNRVAFTIDGTDEKYYGYLGVFSDYTIDDITYIVDDMVYSIFGNMRSEESD